MASTLPPVKGATYNFPVSLVSQADTDIFKTTVTITTADVWVSKDGGAFVAAAAAPTELLTGGGAKTGVLWQNLTAAEMTADIVTVLYHDAADSEWQDAQVTIYTAAQTHDTTDAAVDTISGKVIGTLATGTHNPQSGDTYAIVNHVTYGNSALNTDIDAILLDTGTDGVVLKAAGLATDAAAEIAAAVGGTGATSHTITVNDGASLPIDGVEVWVTTDTGGSNTVASGTTSALGQVTFLLDPGTYYVWCQHARYNGTNPTTVVVS